MRLSTTRGELVRAVLDGVAANVADLVGLVARDTGIPVQRLRVDGGLTQSTTLMQAQADLLQVPIDVYPSAHATALGAAAFAELALHPAFTPREVVSACEPVQTFAPEWSADQAAARLGEWRAAVERTLGDVGTGGTL
jgi:glycerol kinase